MSTAFLDLTTAVVDADDLFYPSSYVSRARVVESFLVKIFSGRVELAQAVFRINYRADSGSVEYTGSGDSELDMIMDPIARRQWRWPTLSRTLIDRLTLSTGGRYIPRFHRTPASDGRGQDKGLRRCFKRAIA